MCAANFAVRSYRLWWKMACQAIRCWTVSKLIGAFLDLSIAYVLLCCSTLAFFISNFLGFFGFSLPCSCNGFLSQPNPDHCLQKLLVESPTDRISAVQLSVRNRFPFDSVWGRNEDCQLSFKVVREKKLESGLIELEGEASCSSISAAKTLQGANNIDLLRKNEELATGEGKFDVKGKGIARNRRQKVNLRRRRKSSTDHIISTANSSYDNVRSGAPVVPLSKHGSGNNGKESSENSTPVDSHDCVSHVMELDDKLWLSSESNSVIDANKSAEKDMVPLGSQRNDVGQHFEYGDQQENAIRILEQALEEERAARSALFFDLEKERTAAATAADEAMAMILRLQEEKAAIELEARQYERILEEKSSYDAEEMDVLKEIIVRREREKHFLEKEVESYKKMLQEKEQFEEEEDCNILDIQGETLLLPGEDENTIDFTDALPLIQCDDIPETAEQVDDSTVELSQEFQEKGLISGASSGQLSMSHARAYQEKSVVLIGELKNNMETESNEQYNGKGPGGNVNVEEELLHDIHVIDDNCDSHDKDNAESSTSTPEVSIILPPLSNSTYEDKVSEFRRHSIATVDHEREKLNNEVGCLRERLRSIQAGREKLNLTMEHRDKGETELLLLDDIANLLQEIRQLTEPHNQISTKTHTKMAEEQKKASTNEGEQQTRHQEIGHKSLLQSDALYQYILETSVYPREPEVMKELRDITAKHPWNIMTTSADEGQFLNMIVKLINAKNTMEIGVYTGYSLLATALALPDDGKILAMDINRENYELGLPVIQKAGVAHKIEFKEGPALPVLDQMLADEKNLGSYDFIFVDADKDNYWNYHKRLIDLIKVGGLIGYDNTLWNGSVVAADDAPMRKYVKYYRDFVLEFNKSIVADPRVEICQLPVGDGITLCRRIA